MYENQLSPPNPRRFDGRRFVDVPHSPSKILGVSAFRRVLLVVALLAFATMGAFPPWVSAPENHPSATTPVGYHFILQPPSLGPAGPAVWSSKRQRFERDGKPVEPVREPSAWERISARLFEGPVRIVRIDYARLGVQAIALSALVGALVLVSSRRTRVEPSIRRDG